MVGKKMEIYFRKLSQLVLDPNKPYFFSTRGPIPLGIIGD